MLGSGLQVLFELRYSELHEHTLIYSVLYGYLTAKLFEYNLGKPWNGGKFTINSSLQTLKELVKGTHEDTTSCTKHAHIIIILLYNGII